MGKFNQFVTENTEEDSAFEQSRQLKDELIRIHMLLKDIDKQEDQTTVLTNQINTTIGFLNQLTIRMQHPYLATITEQILEKNKSFMKQLDDSHSLNDEAALLETLKKLEEQTAAYYQTVKKEAEMTIEKGIGALEERDSLLPKVEKKAQQVDVLSSYVEEQEQLDTLKNLAVLYGNAMKKSIQSLTGLEDEMKLLKQWQEQATPLLEVLEQAKEHTKKATLGEQIFPLFAKINDQIVSYQEIFENGKRYVKYHLEDGHFYLAVVEDKKMVDESYHLLEQNASLSHEQNKAAWCKNLEVILSCLQVYYQMNEFMRYQEFSNRGVMTKEKDLEIKKYKELLSYMEQGILKQYLEYADLLSKKTLIGENAADQFYPDIKTSLEETKVKECQQRIVVSILGNKDAKKEVTTRDILNSLYEMDEKIFEKIEKEPIKGTPAFSNQDLKESSSLLNNDISMPRKETSQTNYDQLATYFEKRKEALEMPLPQDETASPSLRKEEALYKDVNAYFDLEQARRITNLLYEEKNKGQGDSAKFAFLKEGKLGGFTAKYQARNLASCVDRDQYFYLMLVQAIKDYATFNEQRKKDPHFGEGIEMMFSMVGQAVLEDQFDGKKLVGAFLEDDKALIALQKNFDGRYLIKEKQDEPLFDSVLHDYERGNPMFAAKVKQSLDALRNQFRQEGYHVPIDNRLMPLEIPTGKVAA